MLKKIFSLFTRKNGDNDSGIYGVNEWTGFTAQNISGSPCAEYADTPARWKALWEKIGVDIPCDLPKDKAAAVYMSGYGLQNYSAFKAGALNVESAGQGAYVASIPFEATGTAIPIQQGVVWGVRLVPGPYDFLYINGIEAGPIGVSGTSPTVSKPSGNLKG